MTTERRALAHPVELRTTGDRASIRGYAYVFDKLSADLGGFRERIERGAGRQDMERSELVATFNHDFGKPLGRTGYGLRTGVDDVGGWYEIDLPDTTTGRDVAELIERGIVRGSSLMFRLKDDNADQEWTRDETSGFLVRTVKDFTVLELGPVTTPAYPDTSVARRSIPDSLRTAHSPEGQRVPSAQINEGAKSVTSTLAETGVERARVEHQLQHASDDNRTDLEARLLDILDRLDNRFSDQEAEARAAETRATVLELLETHNIAPQSPRGHDDNTTLRSLREGDSAEFRAILGVTVDPTNKQAGKAVPVRTLYTQLLQLIEERSFVVAAGARVIRTTSGEVIDFPRVRPVRPTAKTAEGAALPENYPTTDTVPLGADKYGYVSHVSAELVSDDVVDLVGFLAADAAPNLVDQMGRDWVASLLAPATGIVPEMRAALPAQIPKDTTVSDAVIDLFYMLPSYAAERGVFISGRKVIRRVRKLKGDDGQYLLKSATDGATLTLMGRPVVIDPAFSTASTENTLVFSDLGGYTVRFAGPLRVARSTDVKFIEDLVSFKFVQRAGGALIDTTGSALLTFPA